MRHALELPLPPSTNDLWVPVPRGRGGRGRVSLVKTKEAKAYARVCALIARAQRCPRFEGEVRAELVVYLRDRRSDGDNRIKAVLDALQGIAYANDRQVTAGSWRVEYDAKHPRVALTLEGEAAASAKPPRRQALPVPPARDASAEERQAWEEWIAAQRDASAEEGGA